MRVLALPKTLQHAVCLQESHFAGYVQLSNQHDNGSADYNSNVLGIPAYTIPVGVALTVSYMLEAHSNEVM
jgi:hypothetical protein